MESGAQPVSSLFARVRHLTKVLRTLPVLESSADRGADTTNTLVSSAAFLGELIANIGDAASEVRGVSIHLSARLCAVATCLRGGGVAISDSGVPELSEELLHEIERIVTWPKRSKQFTAKPTEELVTSLNTTLSSSKATLRSTVKKYLTEAPSSLRTSVVEICDQIIAKAPAEPPGDGIQSEMEDCILHQAVEEFLAAVRKCSVCTSGSCEGLSAPSLKKMKLQYHPTRLYLGKPQQSGDATILLDLLVSSHLHHYWQEIALVTPRSNESETDISRSQRTPKGKCVRFANELGPPFSPESSRAPRREVSGFCEILARKSCARIFLELEGQHLVEGDAVETLHHDCPGGEGIPLEHILSDYDIGIPERIRLAFSIARAFWQLYNTNMMMMRWTDRNIWFTPCRNDMVSRKAYIALPLQQEEAHLEEYIQGGLIHRCPRIFTLGVLLLEIGLARPIRTQHPEPTDRFFPGKTNQDHATATGFLKKLKKESWAGYQNKRLFDRAIDDCLNGTNFSPGPYGAAGCTSIAERQRVLYEKVVEPLGLLAGSFPSGAHSTIKKKSEARAGDVLQITDKSVTSRLEVDELSPSMLGSFHAGGPANPKEWLEDLRKIGRYVHMVTTKAGQEKKKLTPIRVAILDSGCNLQAEYFQEEPQRASRIVRWMDFVDEPCSEKKEDQPPAQKEKKDSFGHGTLMAMLLVDIAPTAELILGRVAENTDRLDGRELSISKAIKWAGIDCEADIISMSFGVCDAGGHISDAILDVRRSRKDRIIFLASAGNSGPHQDIAFPACRDDVVSIRATDYLGAVVPTNPPTDWRGAVSFATFGDNIPPRLVEKHDKPEVCKPGSSVATAVSAGIAATMLSYAALLPLLFPVIPGTERLQNLSTRHGVLALFELLSDDVGNRMRFINPAKFLADRRDNTLRLCALMDCARKITMNENQDIE